MHQKQQSVFIDSDLSVNIHDSQKLFRLNEKKKEKTVKDFYAVLTAKYLASIRCGEEKKNLGIVTVISC